MDFVKWNLLVEYDDFVFPTEFAWTFQCQALTTKFLFNIFSVAWTLCSLQKSENVSLDHCITVVFCVVNTASTM